MFFFLIFLGPFLAFKKYIILINIIFDSYNFKKFMKYILKQHIKNNFQNSFVLSFFFFISFIILSPLVILVVAIIISLFFKNKNNLNKIILFSL